MNFVQQALRNYRDWRRGFRVIPHDEILTLLWRNHNSPAGWNRLEELWPDLDIDEVKRLNPIINPTATGSVLRTKRHMHMPKREE